MLLPVDYNRGDLLVHEEEDGEEKGGDGGDDVEVPGALVVDERDQPAPGVTPGGLEDCGHGQLGGGESEAVVDQDENHDGDDDGVVSNHGPHLEDGENEPARTFYLTYFGREVRSELEPLEEGTQEEGPEEEEERKEENVWRVFAALREFSAEP